MKTIKLPALVLACVLAALVAGQAFADARLQGSWTFDDPSLYAALVFSGPNFVWVIEDVTYVGYFSASGGSLAMHVTHIHLLQADLWIVDGTTSFRYEFRFDTNDRLIVHDWVYLRD